MDDFCSMQEKAVPPPPELEESAQPESQQPVLLLHDLTDFLNGTEFSLEEFEAIIRKHSERIVSREQRSDLQTLVSVIKEFIRLHERNATFERYLAESKKVASYDDKIAVLLSFYPEPSLYRNLRIEELLNSCTTTHQNAEDARVLLMKSGTLRMSGKATSLGLEVGALPLIVSSLFNKPAQREGQLEFSQAAEVEPVVLTEFASARQEEIAAKPLSMRQRLRNVFIGLAKRFVAQQSAPTTSENQTDGSESGESERTALQNLIKKLSEKVSDLTKDELRYLLEEACLGENGLMLDASFSQYGEALVRDTVERAAASADKNRPLLHKEAVVKAGTAFLEALTPELRTEVFITFLMSYLKYANSDLMWERILIDVAQKFTFGLKLLQMENLVPPHLRALAASSKENSPPVSKFYVHGLIKDAGLAELYPKIHKVLGSASTATVYTVDENSGARINAAESANTSASNHLDEQKVEATQDGETTFVLKVIKDTIRANFIIEKRAFSVAIEAFLKEADIELSFDPKILLEELSKSVEEELDPTNEAFNTKLMNRFRLSRLKNGIKIPRIVKKHRDFLIMTLAKGRSLASLQENPLAGVDLSTVSFKIVNDFFKQVFVAGLFHTDEHAGNIFVQFLKGKKEPQITIIDHGQVALIESSKSKSMLLKFFLGFLRKDIRMIAATVKQTIDLKNEGKSVISEKDIIARLSGGIDALIDKTLELLVEHDCGYELARFSKGILSIYSMIEELTPMQKMRIFLPFIRKFHLQKEVINSAVSFSMDKIKNIFLGRRKNKAMRSERAAQTAMPAPAMG